MSRPKVHRVKMCSWPSTQRLILGFLHSEALRWKTHSFDIKKSRCSEGEVTSVKLQGLRSLTGQNGGIGRRQKKENRDAVSVWGG